MAQKIRVRLVDDLDGSQADETVSFTFDGKPREIELSRENAAKFRALMEPYMLASHPAKADNLAVKGAPAPTQASLREEAAAIRDWAYRHHLPINPLGRIPEKTRKAWERHTRHGDRSALDGLLARAGIDPSLPAGESRNVVPIAVGKASPQDQLERLARTIGKLSPPQEKRLREACAGDGSAIADDATDRSSYEALCRRGCMTLEAVDTYLVTDVGRTWVRLNQTALSA
ncbi:Lsr2 family protein [Streptomyces sp. NPDC059080]|uniref:histone-like nucleoid-structuring protein Lsr2 n=1 Tax=Streptomyces sp. NPDC059080 TaxID=3346718 RepID=UPI00367DEE60